MFTIEMLPGGPGDCLWIEYGKPAAPRRILVDGGASAGAQSALRKRVRASTSMNFPTRFFQRLNDR